MSIKSLFPAAVVLLVVKVLKLAVVEALSIVVEAVPMPV